MFQGETRLEFLSTPSVRRATQATNRRLVPTAISIHALREEGDVYKRSHVLSRRQFLSTPSVRRATRLCPAVDDRFQISIHALREEGDLAAGLADLVVGGISIHALREEGDSSCFLWACPHLRFLSTPSARRATSFPSPMI